jgi:zinc transporter ZupT
MHLFYNLLLFFISFVGGVIGLRLKVNEKGINYLLAFSGSFLLCITLLHLLPETFKENEHAGLYILCGFFLQLLIQRMTHGVEHGHIHTHTEDHHDHGHAIHFKTIFWGLAIHAFMEGLPLGFHYRDAATEPSLYLAVAAHKLPEVILLSTLAIAVQSRKEALFSVFIFSAITPLGAFAAAVLGRQYYTISQAVTIIIPIVAGVFIHIATTIFFESGTKHHLLTRNKVLAILLGITLGLLSLLLE